METECDRRVGRVTGQETVVEILVTERAEATALVIASRARAR